LVIGLTWLSGSALVLGLFGAEIARMITSDPGIVAVAAAIFLVFAISQIADGVQSTMLGALRGMSDTGWPAGVSIIAYWVVALPLGWVFAHWLELGPAGIWLGFVAALFGAAAALVWRFLARTRPDPA
jgi:MATE family multidrug resistance protein